MTRGEPSIPMIGITHSILHCMIDMRGKITSLSHKQICPISIMPLSVLLDYHPITITLLFQTRVTSTKIWRLNTSLLMDPGNYVSLSQELGDYFLHNGTPDVSPMMQWEAHKCFIRGQLLAISSRRKREQQELILSLSSKIRVLEAQHKRSLAIKISQDLQEL